MKEKAIDLLEAMSKEVYSFVKHYQTDFTEHDTKRLLKNAKSGKCYYWLIRESGTQLYDKNDLIVDDDNWNERELLYYFKDYEKKLFILTITSNDASVIKGHLQEVDFDKAWKKLLKEVATPAKLKITFKDIDYYFDWTSTGTPSKFLDELSAYLKEPMDWNKIEYEYVFK